MRIQAVIFDLFGTLTSAPWAKFVDSIHALAATLDMDRQVFFEAWTQQTSTRRQTGQFPSIREEIRWICRQHGVEPTDKVLSTAVELRYRFTRSVLRPRADAVSTLRALRSRKILTGLISDCSPDVPEIWPETSLAGLFDTEIFSCSVGVKKPSPTIYRMACERLEVPPTDCFYVGDGFSGELNGAATYGMRPFLLRPPDEECPQSPSWEGNSWNGDVIPSLSSVLDLLPEQPNQIGAGDQRLRAGG